MRNKERKTDFNLNGVKKNRAREILRKCKNQALLRNKTIDCIKCSALNLFKRKSMDCMWSRSEWPEPKQGRCFRLLSSLQTSLLIFNGEGIYYKAVVIMDPIIMSIFNYIHVDYLIHFNKHTQSIY